MEHQVNIPIAEHYLRSAVTLIQETKFEDQTKKSIVLHQLKDVLSQLEMDQILAIKLEDVRLWSFVKEILAKERIRTIGDLAKLTSDQILNIHGLGKSTIIEISKLLSQYNLTLSGSIKFAEEEPESVVPEPEQNTAPDPVFYEKSTEDCTRGAE